jgi:uncharacterized phage protein (TIGR02216 family)
MTERTPWAAMLATALRLGLPPHRFWRLSLREWRAFVASPADRLTRDAFNTLAERFPDGYHD